MKYLCVAVILVCLVAIVILWQWLKKQDALNQTVKNKVRHGNVLLILTTGGIVFTYVLFPLLCWWLFTETVDWVVGIFFCVFVVMIVTPFWGYCLLLWYNWGIYVEDNLIVFL